MAKAGYPDGECLFHAVAYQPMAKKSLIAYNVSASLSHMMKHECASPDLLAYAV
jgi:hypothetical protein